ncbi:hypothetical protein [Leisingera sp. ANG-DT]|uniref:hypothetical protein n=1 Tax=Leisingera sp. ANG-DT TaxID=1577897 RepID=UPI00057F9BA2|nr:hypothetical protein [Leisingera sp. ANG-DT]KIC17366.1 hypothetical protein RA21_08835 [Leisingera sp. ANG-DT]
MPEIDNLEKKVDADRRKLAASLSGVTDMLAPQSVTKQLKATAHGYGGQLSQQAVAAAKRNPAALVLTGAGLALMFAGTGRRPTSPVANPTAVPLEDSFAGFDNRVAAADAAMKKEMTGMSKESFRSTNMRETLNAGLDGLPEAARKRVLNARGAALQAQEKLEAHASKAAARGQTFFEENPLAAGAIALGLGALIGALLPSTRREDEVLGAHRDALAAKAEKALRDEMDKLYQTANAKLDPSASKKSLHTAAS